jgi:hypothetical protein
MERCKKCILPTHVVRMHPDGICYLCHKDNGIIKYKGEAELKSIVERHSQLARKNGAKYDCLIPLSGGKDSMYTLWYIVTQLKKKPLAFNFVHGFIDAAAKSNIDKAIKILGVDIIYNHDNSILTRYLKHNIQVIPSQPVKHIIKTSPVLCTGCNEGYAQYDKALAKKYGLTLIVKGGCPVEPDLRGFRNVTGNSPIVRVLQMSAQEVGELFTCSIFHNLAYPRNIKTHLLLTRFLWKRLFGLIFKKGRKRAVTSIELFSYLEWNDKDIVATLEKELGWQRPAGRSTTIRFDCRLHVLREQLNLLFAGFCEKDVIFSAMIRKGMLTREEALQKVTRETEEEQLLSDDIFRETLDKIGLSDQYEHIKSLWVERKQK